MSTVRKASGSPTPLASPRILVVEDEVLIRMTVSDYLRDCGFHVIEAGRADEAVGILETDIDVDIVFSDINMPGKLDGLGLAQWIQRERAGLKVILTSAVARTAKAGREAFEDGPFLAKPYAHGELEHHIRRLLGYQIST